MKNTNSDVEYSINVYLERRKSKELVGVLRQFSVKRKKRYEFTYSDPYLKKKNSIPLGPEFPLTKRVFNSERLFPSFEDRIPSKENPAYIDYCRSEGISPDETNPMILLATIGKKGPSSFVFEKPIEQRLIQTEVKDFRNSLDLTIREFSVAFDISPMSLMQLEKSPTVDSEVAKRIVLYIRFPETAIYELELNKSRLHSNTFRKVKNRLESLLGPTKNN